MITLINTSKAMIILLAETILRLLDIIISFLIKKYKTHPPGLYLNQSGGLLIKVLKIWVIRQSLITGVRNTGIA